jgi:diadenylate cyclase
VRLGLSGSAMLLKSLRPEQIGVRLDLSDAQVGTNRFTLTPGQITLPPGIVLKDVKPTAVEVSMDIEAQKEVPVQVDWMGKLPENLILTAATILPDRLGIVGDSTVLAAVTTLYTEKIVLDRIKESGSVTVRPVLNPPSLRTAPGSREKVVVEFMVQQRK